MSFVNTSDFAEYTSTSAFVPVRCPIQSLAFASDHTTPSEVLTAVMSAYTPLPGPSSPPRHIDTHAIRLDDSPPRPPRRSLESDSDESDIIYRDALDVEPFDEKDRRFKDEGMMESGTGEDGDGEGQGYVTEPRRLRPRKRSKRVLAALIGILVLAGLIGAFAGTVYSVPTHLVKSGTKHITMDHIFNGTFAVTTKTLNWVKEAPDGTFSRQSDERNIILSTVSNMTHSSLLVNSSHVLDAQGHQLDWQTWRLSPDGKYVLFRSNSVQQWRHSTRGNYWIHRLSDASTFPITAPSEPPQIAFASWSPVGHALAFVQSNDLYIIPEKEMSGKEPRAVRVTTDGSETVFNGVPDWVYEEEVYGTDSVLWWSPDGQTVAYLRSDETEVKNYRLQYYNPTGDAFSVHQYPTELDMKYPKPGTPNPLVSVHTFSLATYAETGSLPRAKQALSWDAALPLADRIIAEVAWVGGDALIVKETDRAARRGSVVVFQGSEKGKVVRKLGSEGEEGDDGWIDAGQNVRPIHSGISGYLDIVPKDGYNALAFFSPVNATKPIWIDMGDKGEVAQISGVDEDQGLIYFVAAQPSIDRHLFSVAIPRAVDGIGYDSSRTALTDVSSGGYHEVSFSPGGRYYVLQYKGPDVPWQKVIEAGEKDSAQLLEGNEKLNHTLSEYARPIISRTTLESDGHTLNMLEMMPSTLDTSGRKKYPVLIRVYGGPGSQTVSNKWERDWHTYLVTEKKYIVIMVDGRGTGFAGRKLRNPVRDDLGHWEVVDQIAAARDAAKRVYVDTSRIGIWGWSYGGYMTCKTLEADSGVISLGMAVAPVTNWLYYDSIYTERYMSVPALNEQGYVQSAVNNVSAFGKVDFILAHGSGDDNVHYMNSASLVDKFTQEHVRGWRFRMFTDSNHGMNKREAFREVYEWMTDFLDEKWGRGGTIKH